MEKSSEWLGGLPLGSGKDGVGSYKGSTLLDMLKVFFKKTWYIKKTFPFLNIFDSQE